VRWQNRGDGEEEEEEEEGDGEDERSGRCGENWKKGRWVLMENI
jgi:hypothetical protein